MARIVKEEEYAGKRNAILDVAQQLIYTRGYEQMTIQDMLDGLRISKGAFYHYFDSKQAVLEALVERLGEEVVQLLLPIVHDPELASLLIRQLKTPGPRLFPAARPTAPARSTGQVRGGVQDRLRLSERLHGEPPAHPAAPAHRA